MLYLTEELRLHLIQAGVVFAFVQGGGVFGRVLWGLMADRWLTTRKLLASLGLLMTVCLLAVIAMTPSWPLITIIAVGIVLGASSFGWNGILLSEVARLAPDGKIGDATGGVQFAMFGGVVVAPPCFGAAVTLTHSYTPAFLGLVALSLAAGVYLLQSRPTAAKPETPR